MEFGGRTFELAYLDRQYAEAKGTLCVVYGRRHIGKTRLLTQWLETRKIPGYNGKFRPQNAIRRGAARVITWLQTAICASTTDF